MRTEIRGGVLEDDDRGPYGNSGADDFAGHDGMRAHARWRRRGAAVAITDAGALLRRPVMIVGGRIRSEGGLVAGLGRVLRCGCVPRGGYVVPAVVGGGVVGGRVRPGRPNREGDGRCGRRLWA